MNNPPRPSSNTVDDATEQFLREGFDGYLDVVRCTHYFQTKVSAELRAVLDLKRERIASVLKLEGSFPEIESLIEPEFPAEKYRYRDCSICARVWLTKPCPCWLWLFISFEENNNPVPTRTLYCALEVKTNRDLNLVQQFFHEHDDRFGEDWEFHAVGLKRPLSSSDRLRAELTALLESFLECFEKNAT